MKLIDVENLSFSYNGEQGRLSILNKLNLSVNKGEFISILGPSGCGKSTLLRLLSGFYRPESGEIRFHDGKVSSPFPEGQMIFQDTGQLLPWLTVGKNIQFPRFRSSLYGRKKKISREDRSLFEELLSTTGLTSFRDYYPNQLSGGLKQRVSLARAIFAGSEIIFLDEPFVSLDAPSRSELQQLLLKLWKSGGRTIFFVTHDISEALLLSDKILIFPGDKKDIRLVGNDLKRPRNRDDQSFIKEKLQIYSAIDSI